MKNFILTLLFCFVFTSLKAQKQDTIAYQNLDSPKHIFVKSKAISISVGIFGLGLALEFFKTDRYCWQNKYSFQNKTQKTFSGFTTNADDFLRFAPFALVARLNMSKVKAKHKTFGQVTRLIGVQLLMDLTLTRLKRYTKYIHPHGQFILSHLHIHLNPFLLHDFSIKNLENITNGFDGLAILWRPQQESVVF